MADEQVEITGNPVAVELLRQLLDAQDRGDTEAEAHARAGLEALAAVPTAPAAGEA